ncbi:MAG: sorting protein [Pedosphaera sp.]|nr:sorting protein [Pedosphaera sp.]
MDWSMHRRLTHLAALLCLAAGVAGSGAQTSVVFTNNFDGALPAEIQPGTALLTGVQGYGGLGPAGNQFGNFFLRSATANLVTLTLSNLPPHRTLTLAMLFAAIDSLDGTGTFPSGDFLAITLDGNLIFRESFANATLSQVQSYVAPPGGELARHVDLGFTGPGSYYTDSAYDFGVDSRFQGLPHTNSTAVLTFQIEGAGIQDLSDESWAMDNLGISAAGVPPPVITEILKAGANVTVKWSAVSNLTYRVQSKTNLSDASWNDLAPTVTATSSNAIYAEPLSLSHRFYRVMVLP